MKVHPYLNFDGQAEEAFKFYRSVFGGEFMTHMKMTDAPDSDKFPKKEQNRVMHISLPIGADTILMASDTVPSMDHELNKGNNSYISLHPDSKEEADRLFQALSEDGDIEMHLQNQFWGDYYGSLTDKFGVKWMVNFRDQSEETMKELEELLPEDTSIIKTGSALAFLNRYFQSYTRG